MPRLQPDHSISGLELQFDVQLWMAGAFLAAGSFSRMLERDILEVETSAETALSIHADLALFHTTGLLSPVFWGHTLKDPRDLVFISDQCFWQIYQLDKLLKEARSFVNQQCVLADPDPRLWEQRLKSFLTREQSGYEEIPLQSEEESPRAMPEASTKLNPQAVSLLGLREDSALA